MSCPSTKFYFTLALSTDYLSQTVQLFTILFSFANHKPNIEICLSTAVPLLRHHRGELRLQRTGLAGAAHPGGRPGLEEAGGGGQTGPDLRRDESDTGVQGVEGGLHVGLLRPPHGQERVWTRLHLPLLWVHRLRWLGHLGHSSASRLCQCIYQKVMFTEELIWPNLIVNCKYL